MNKISERINSFLKYFSYIFYTIIIASYIGVGIAVPSIMITVNNYLKVGIGLFLVYRFIPFRDNITFDELDRRVAFSAGMFILTTTVLDKYFSDITNAPTVLKKEESPKTVTNP
jgi:hypothetical protein